MGTLLFAMMGWCGTKYPGWWKDLFKPHPHPDPEPWWNVGIMVLGVAAGVGGGIVFRNSFGDDQFFAGQVAIASSLAAFGTSSIVTGIAAAVKG